MAPVHIVFSLGAPVAVATRPLHLDGLVGFAAAREAKINGQDSEAAVANLPFDRRGDPSVWAASQILFEPSDTPMLVGMRRVTSITQMADDRRAGYFATKKETITLGTGTFKSYDFRLAVQWCTQAHAWALTTDIGRLRALLDEIPGLGKTQRNSWGTITAVSITQDERAETLWRMRALPINATDLALPRHLPSTGTLHPPYWDRRRWAPILEWPSSYLASADLGEQTRAVTTAA